ncbi:uncharacterized protein NECHADRAFT_83587 [Fusarium vanettenii 77-13-4]|uniref:Uncharacterized protein n=1 Tax=Fusarium vanettenii (strain ATCC MYA-4622 / CBS 123669 / FGSC 9596 / NRRL 45880 / 77-13-4) TaxID=660122 RepID=C7YY69_FUSV7|nr:uncharacterized protein NECHADRAFT_83587 [Fusarium vanettenii 77-13-4]EEU42950.1 predicted protein [Fusarium vanettenii 77-13-4]
MCFSKNTIWACHRCGTHIDNQQTPVGYCPDVKKREKCFRAFVNVFVACDPALCLYCGFHKHEMYDEVEHRVWDMSLGQGLLGSRRVKYFWGLDPAPTWEAFESAEQERIADVAKMRAPWRSGESHNSTHQAA